MLLWGDVARFAIVGEKRVRKVTTIPGVEAVRTKDVKDQIEISGIDITKVSLTGEISRNLWCTISWL